MTLKKLKQYLILFLTVLLIVFLVRYGVVSNNKNLPEILDYTTYSEKSDIGNNDNLEKLTILSVIDGDTIWVINENDEKQKVRFIGVDTPESVHSNLSKNTEQGKIASNYTKSELKKDQIIYLEYDKEKIDKYGRTLAYIWLKNDIDTNNEENIRKYMYNAKLLELGYANTMTVEPNTKNKAIFEKIKSEAKQKQAGFWKNSEVLKWE